MKRIGLIALAGLLFVGAMARDAVSGWIDRTEIPLVLTESSVEMRDRNGDMLRVFPVADGLWRLRPRLDKVDTDFLRLLVRYEDKRFWHHDGVDAVALLRAVGQAIWHGELVSGGSTLTMQVARLLEDGRTGTWSGKLRQMRVALALERQYDKREILAHYLTHAPYGGNLEGIRAATLVWFGKEPNRLTPAQSALLVALPQRPEARRPDRHPEIARAARDRVLTRMVGQGILAAPAARVASDAALPDRMRSMPRQAAHLTDLLRRAVPEITRHDLTLDVRVQKAMEALARDAVRNAGARVSAALVVADHTTGEIIASVGSPSYDDADGRHGFVDMTRAMRSPGSTLKPLIYGLAFDQGLAHPDTLIHDGPVQFGRYAPRNFDGQFRGDVRVREALQMSLNIPVVKLARDIGPPRIMAALRRADVTAQLAGGVPGLAVSLGGVGVSLRDLVQLYAVIAQGGLGPKLHVTKTALRGTTRRAMSDVAAWHLGDILSDLAPPPGAPGGVLAYKTGTSYGHRDAWALGFDGQHVIGVWMGRADGTPVPGAFGGDLAAPVLFAAFGRLKNGFATLPPPPPSTLILSTADLPPPLQRYRSRNSHFQTPTDAPDLVFPPDGAILEVLNGPLSVKLRGGNAPYMVLANGYPVSTGQRRAEFDIPNPGPGYSTLVVVDRDGKSDRVTIRLE